MKTLRLGKSDLDVTRIGLGCMPLGGAWDNSPLTDDIRKRALLTVHAALDQGIAFFDHADIYCRGKSEEAFAGIWQKSPNLRQKIVLQSKCGIRFADDPAPGAPHRFDFSYEHIVNSVEGILKRLQTDYLDVLLLHRPDPLVEPEEVARAWDALHQSGKVCHFGVSNHTAGQMALLQAFVKQPIVANQIAMNVLHTHVLDEGIVFNQNRTRITRNEDTIEYCRLHNITLQAWGPLAWGKLSGGAKEPLSEAETKAAQAVATLAQEKGVSAEAILVAWLLRHPARIQPIIGTTKPERITASCQADNVQLSREEWYRLFTAGRGENLP
jgi:predicted oxidoreductase